MTTPVKLLVLDGCEPCDELKEIVKPMIEAGEIQLVDGMSDEGQKFLHEHREIDHVPYAFIEDSPGNIRKCDVRREGEVILFECKPKA